VRSIRLGQQDLTADPVRIPLQTEGTLDIVMGMDGGSLDGRVLNDRQEPAVNVKVALIPDAPLRRRLDLFKSTTTDRSGVFRIANVPPGDYRVFAWEDAEDGAWMNPEFLRPDESRGRPVRVSARGRETVDVPVIVGKR
jgi:hypothetical protein